MTTAWESSVTLDAQTMLLQPVEPTGTWQKCCSDFTTAVSKFLHSTNNTLKHRFKPRKDQLIVPYNKLYTIRGRLIVYKLHKPSISRNGSFVRRTSCVEFRKSIPDSENVFHCTIVCNDKNLNYIARNWQIKMMTQYTTCTLKYVVSDLGWSYAACDVTYLGVNAIRKLCNFVPQQVSLILQIDLSEHRVKVKNAHVDGVEVVGDGRNLLGQVEADFTYSTRRTIAVYIVGNMRFHYLQTIY